MKSDRMVMRTCTFFEATAVGVEQDLDELGSFVPLPRLLDAAAAVAEAGEAEAEQFLELIDDKEKRPPVEAARFL